MIDLQYPRPRPILRYHGGKWRKRNWIISHFRPHRIYTEAYGGGGSVLLAKERSHAEVYNDLDSEIVNLFRVVRERGLEIRAALALTPYARDEYRQSFLPSDDPMEQARRTVIRSFMGFGSNALCRSAKSGFRSNSNRSHTTPAHDWANYPAALDRIIKRLQGVIIENRHALDVLACHDGVETLHYVDPPYVHSTRTAWAGRGSRAGYRHEMTDQDHQEMAMALRRLSGTVILSGYRCPIYDDLFSDWQRFDDSALADGARPRLESLWIKESGKP